MMVIRMTITLKADDQDDEIIWMMMTLAEMIVITIMLAEMIRKMIILVKMIRLTKMMGDDHDDNHDASGDDQDDYKDAGGDDQDKDHDSQDRDLLY